MSTRNASGRAITLQRNLQYSTLVRKLPPDVAGENSQVRSLFGKIDTDNNGIISLEELNAAPRDVQALQAELDAFDTTAMQEQLTAKEVGRLLLRAKQKTANKALSTKLGSMCDAKEGRDQIISEIIAVEELLQLRDYLRIEQTGFKNRDTFMHRLVDAFFKVAGHATPLEHLTLEELRCILCSIVGVKKENLYNVRVVEEMCSSLGEERVAVSHVFAVVLIPLVLTRRMEMAAYAAKKKHPGEALQRAHDVLLEFKDSLAGLETHMQIQHKQPTTEYEQNKNRAQSCLRYIEMCRGRYWYAFQILQDAMNQDLSDLPGSSSITWHNSGKGIGNISAVLYFEDEYELSRYLSKMGPSTSGRTQRDWDASVITLTNKNGELIEGSHLYVYGSVAVSLYEKMLCELAFGGVGIETSRDPMNHKDSKLGTYETSGNNADDIIDEFNEDVLTSCKRIMGTSGGGYKCRSLGEGGLQVCEVAVPAKEANGKTLHLFDLLSNTTSAEPMIKQADDLMKIQMVCGTTNLIFYVDNFCTFFTKANMLLAKGDTEGMNAVKREKLIDSMSRILANHQEKTHTALLGLECDSVHSSLKMLRENRLPTGEKMKLHLKTKMYETVEIDPTHLPYVRTKHQVDAMWNFSFLWMKDLQR